MTFVWCAAFSIASIAQVKGTAAGPFEIPAGAASGARTWFELREYPNHVLPELAAVDLVISGSPVLFPGQTSARRYALVIDRELKAVYYVTMVTKMPDDTDSRTEIGLVGLGVPVSARPGPKGDPGLPGAIGESAYLAARRNGFNGSESEWIASLKGKDGVSPVAIPGPPGPAGGTPIVTLSTMGRLEAGSVPPLGGIDSARPVTTLWLEFEAASNTDADVMLIAGLSATCEGGTYEASLRVDLRRQTFLQPREIRPGYAVCLRVLGRGAVSKTQLFYHRQPIREQ